MKQSSLFKAAMLATFAAAGTASAQGVNSYGGLWQSGWVPGTQINELWNNPSQDGNRCNIGYFVKGNFGPCNFQHPAVFPSPLSWVNATYLSQNPAGIANRTVFDFQAGTYNITFYGGFAGATPPRNFGVQTSDGSSNINGVASITFAPATSTIQVTSTTAWKFFLQSFAPTTSNYTSLDLSPRQFALFANSNGANGDNATQWFVGGEDNSCLALNPAGGCSVVSDYDYNDAMALVTAVPEPSTYAMMSIGLLSIGGLVRRRRNANKA